LLLINCYYVASYFYIRWSEAEKSLRQFRQRHAAQPGLATTTFQVSKGTASLLLEFDEIAYCYREGENNFLRTMAGEDFFIGQSLDEMQQLLPEKEFFRLNRQMLANRSTCKRYHLLTYGKLSAELLPPFKSDVVISQKRAAAFKDWLEPKSEQQYQLSQSG
jgi:DNA-binding LytR/AlgR family response regulator